ncbi:DUF2809 domain-containing protein [Brucella pituitosa]|uniref:DUF2809 domain-containing protein n=1 Tax=Brucella pituitosa TaxID=571256 RepID=A0A643F630_9HYPH|nr:MULTISPECIES: DUF2809 domain-containing protein [Brucella]PQZ47113.1 DUF2809 domain-containing protein [Ochrobactrum sp. MYb19]PRA54078.1 DUF2809 domain-containing protein [Ochrobactrum sp. MYb68]PRA61704.1 DUF2809 domain-containing protein [Ochrobactrum sp. MYb18]PRA77970.1 DUF2809 domain-containing protein [Brucella thiophenivorans]PRA85817.1 DUF2809 domain-containing protein [Ochrobactrum sp. MYb14]PRA87089.1 DUF2809 domain-containing protein [Ochrobactrum sp. MYb29]PRA98526.1 DUF2809 
MQFKFSLPALIVTIALLVALALLATAGAGLGWIRSFLGDVIAVIFVYSAFRIMIDGNRVLLAFAAFLVGAAIELGQYLAKITGVEIGNRALRIILGATPDWLDVLAYGLGAVLIIAFLALNRGLKLARRA